jgi:excisionase family DNA binding protein
MEKLITPEEAASLLSVSPRTVKDWLRRGDLNGVKAGNLWRIRESDLERFLHVQSRLERTS